MRSTQLYLIQYDRVFLRKGDNWTQRQTCTEGRQNENTQGKFYVKMETETGIMLLEAKKCLRLPETKRGKP